MSRFVSIPLVILLAVCVLEANPAGAVELAPGDILVGVCFNPPEKVGVIRVDPVTGSQERIVPGVKPVGLAIDPEGRVIIATSNDILRFDPSTEVLEKIAYIGYLGSTSGLVLAGNGIVYTTETPATETHESFLLATDLATGTSWIVSGDGLLRRSKDAAIAANGDILVSTGEPRTLSPAGLIRVDPETGAQSAFSVGSPPYYSPLGVALAPDGRIFVADPDSKSRAIIEVDPDTGFTKVAYTGALLWWPLDIAFDANGDLIVTEGRQEAVIRIDAETGEQTIVSQGGFLDQGCLFSVAIVPEPPALEVAIDIQPHTARNQVPLQHGVVRVAILGSPDFDVDEVDPTTLAFGPGQASPIAFAGPARPRPRDVSGDRLPDLLSDYRVEDARLEPGESEACVTGRTVEGRAFAGCDTVRTVPACGRGFEVALLLPLVALRRSFRRGR